MKVERQGLDRDLMMMGRPEEKVELSRSFTGGAASALAFSAAATASASPDASAARTASSAA